ncbi:MAG: RCC1 domain-containing protein, partial [Gaiellaceae bacterium]
VNFGSVTAISFTNGVATVAGASNGVMRLYRAGTSNITVAEAGSYTSNAVSVTVGPGALESFTIPTPTTRAAGTAFTVSLTAYDAYGNTKTDYTGSQCIALSGSSASPNGTAPLYPAQGSCGTGQSAITFTNGVAATVGITLYNATPSTLYPTATTTITATDAPSGKSGSTNPFNVTGTEVQSRFLILAATTTPTAGQADNLTIIMGDLYGNPVTAYAGNINLYFDGANAIGTYNPTVTPRNNTTGTNFRTSTSITFSGGVAQVNAGQNGVMRLYRVETANITVRLNTGTPNRQSIALPVSVRPAAINTYTVATPGTQTAGTTFNVSITLSDIYGNGNFGSRCLTFSGPVNGPDGTPPSYPAQGSCAAGQSEVNFTGAPMLVPITLYRAGATTLTVTDVTSGLVRTTGSFTVNPAAIDHFAMTAATTTPVVGTADSLSITAVDPFGNTATGYTGSHNLTFSGAGSIRTYDPTVTNSAGAAIDFGAATAINFTNGVATVAGANNGVMRLYKVQTAHIVVSDGSHDNGSGLEITPIAGAMDNLSLAAEKVVVRPGAPDQLTVRAIDQYGNTAVGYSDGSHNVTFAGGTGTRTVTNSGGGQINFGSATAITFTNGVSTQGGVLRISNVQTANITASDGVHTSSAFRIVVSDVSASAVSAGSFHTCAVVGGAVECWGSDDSGQLGNGNPLTNSSTPVMVSGLANVTQISAGKYHTCALRNDGTVWCWGLNDYGELGNNSTTNSPTPVQVRGVGGTGYLTGVTEVDANGKFTCARLSSGEVRCWGRNQSGQLGSGAADNNTHSTPVAVVGVGGGGTLTGVSAITAGANHACALRSGGTVDCWGLNDHGQLGDGTTTTSPDPVQVLGPGGTGYLSGVTQIDGGRMHVCALLPDSTVYCWGRNENGELGDGTKVNRSAPVRSGGISTASSISAGEYHSCARLADGTAQCWGAAAFGQIGDGTTADTSTPVTVIGPGGFGILTGIAEISAGGGDITETDDFEHTCALTNDNTVICWGQNNYGQLGDGTTTMSIFPTGVALL